MGLACIEILLCARHLWSEKISTMLELFNVVCLLLFFLSQCYSALFFEVFIALGGPQKSDTWKLGIFPCTRVG